MPKTPKYLITGCSGFVGKHFLDYLEKNDIAAEVLGVDIVRPAVNQGNYQAIKFDYIKLDLLDKHELKKILQRFTPDYILHLASFSSVAFSWENPIISFQNNTNIFLNLVEAIRELKLNCRVLSVGSSEEYGNLPADKMPITEDAPLSPVSVYAVARVAQEELSRVFARGYGLDIVLTRSFNHCGPGQSETFVIASFARQMIQLKNNILSGDFICGDVNIIRDFLDVRDVVAAYYLLLQKGRSGDTYNVCSGQGRKLSEIIEMMSGCLGIKINVRVDARLVRPSDNLVIVGSNEKIKREVSWTPKIPFSESIQDILNYWERELSGQNSD